MPSTHAFQSSFWSPTATIDPYPNFRHGFDILHSRLTQSMRQNDSIQKYIEQRIECEKKYSENLLEILPLMEITEEVSTLSDCFRVVCEESERSGQEHFSRAENVRNTSLDPLQRFSARYRKRVMEARRRVEVEMDLFEDAIRHLEQSRQDYQAKAHALVQHQPHYKPLLLRLGNRWFNARSQVDHWLNTLATPCSLQDLKVWLTEESQHESVMHDLVGHKFLRCKNSLYHKVTPVPSQATRLSGFFKRQPSSDLEEMNLADVVYRNRVIRLDRMRTQTEEILFVHYSEMESLELERIQTLKQAFISLAASLSNTIPRYKETVDTMMLYQETLKPDKDVQLIVEQYRTGQFCPRPILYQNFFCGAAHHQLFGVPLDDIVRMEGTLVPQFLSDATNVIESGLLKLQDEEIKRVWTSVLPLDRIYTVREKVNNQHPFSTYQLLSDYDVLSVASLVRQYLVELPECLFTFELYEPFKLLYANQKQDEESRLFSVSKLIATLPTVNYNVCKLLFSHFNAWIKDKKFSRLLGHEFGYILLRPKIETKVSTFERHGQKLTRDLIDHHLLIFTNESEKAQKDNSTRPTVSSMDSLEKIIVQSRGNLLPSSSTLFEDPDELSVPKRQSLVESTEYPSLNFFLLEEEE